jgi:hypothetical protein
VNREYKNAEYRREFLMLLNVMDAGRSMQCAGARAQKNKGTETHI